MIESAAQTLVGIAVAFGLPLLAVIFYFKGAFVGKPIPASIVLPGFIVATQPTFLGSIGIAFLCSVSSVLGETTIYHGIKKHDIGFLNRLPYVSFSEEKLATASARFEEYGGLSILVGSAVPGVRGLIIIPAALASYPAHRAALASLVGTHTYHVVLVLGTLGVLQIL